MLYILRMDPNTAKYDLNWGGSGKSENPENPLSPRNAAPVWSRVEAVGRGILTVVLTVVLTVGYPHYSNNPPPVWSCVVAVRAGVCDVCVGPGRGFVVVLIYLKHHLLALPSPLLSDSPPPYPPSPHTLLNSATAVVVPPTLWHLKSWSRIVQSPNF